MKGYVVYLLKEKKLITTQHVKNIKTLSKAQNAQLLEHFNETSADTEVEATITDTVNGADTIKTTNKSRNKSTSGKSNSLINIKKPCY